MIIIKTSNILKQKTFIILLLISYHFLLFPQEGRKTIDMDFNWKFSRGTHKEAIDINFDDSAWEKVNVPHDWSIKGRYNRSNPTGRGGGYLPSGDSWYRKSFNLPESDKGKTILVEFDGVMANSEVYINGELLGIWPYGYTTFQYDISDHIKFGDDATNALTVRANTMEQPASRWYTGAGIYRHVRMIVKEPVHVTHWGQFVTTPKVSKSKATVNNEVEINNKTNKDVRLTIQSTIIDSDGKSVKTSSSKLRLKPNTSEKIVETIVVNNPQLWDLENTNMYQMVTKVLEGSKLLDEEKTDFGIRSIKFDPAKGFFLNEEPLKIYGACMHHDGGAVGAAVPLGVWEYRFNRLKEAGINAIRTAHNPMAPEFYDLCDRMGILVMNENFDTWNYAKNKFDYNLYFDDWWEEDTRAMVLRDRNHPSIVLYSVGNEIRDNLNNEEGFRKYKQQQDLINKLDPTRPVTMALFRPNSSGVYNNGFADMMDVVGQNYRPGELLAAHKQNPERIVIGTENIHDLETYLALRDNEFMVGQFLWTGFDYLGENVWPKISFGTSLFDKTGGWNTEGLLRKAWWGSEPTVSVVRRADNAGEGEWVHDWTPMDPVAYDEAYLNIYTNAEEVELFLNNESLGVFERLANHAPIPVQVNYQKGELRAEARTAGEIVAQDIQITAGAPHSIILTPHKTKIANNREDVSYVRATIVDENGVRCPNAFHLIEFAVDGAGELIATDSADIFGHEQYIASERPAYMGECIAIIKANKDNGNIKVTARAEGVDGIATTEIIVE